MLMVTLKRLEQKEMLFLLLGDVVCSKCSFSKSCSPNIESEAALPAAREVVANRVAVICLLLVLSFTHDCQKLTIVWRIPEVVRVDVAPIGGELSFTLAINTMTYVT